MPLGMDYGGRPCPRPHCVRWGLNYPPNGHSLPNFQPMSIVAKRLDGSRCHLVVGTEVGLGPGDIVLDGYPAPPKGAQQPPHFSAHVYCGQTVTHLSNCWALVCLFVTMVDCSWYSILASTLLYYTSEVSDVLLLAMSLSILYRTVPSHCGILRQ